MRALARYRLQDAVAPLDGHAVGRPEGAAGDPLPRARGPQPAAARRADGQPRHRLLRGARARARRLRRHRRSRSRTTARSCAGSTASSCSRTTARCTRCPTRRRRSRRSRPPRASRTSATRSGSRSRPLAVSAPRGRGTGAQPVLHARGETGMGTDQVRLWRGGALCALLLALCWRRRRRPAQGQRPRALRGGHVGVDGGDDRRGVGPADRPPRPRTARGASRPRSTNIGAYMWSAVGAEQAGIIGHDEAVGRLEQTHLHARGDGAPQERPVLQLVRPPHGREAHGLAADGATTSRACRRSTTAGSRSG